MVHNKVLQTGSNRNIKQNSTKEGQPLPKSRSHDHNSMQGFLGGDLRHLPSHLIIIISAIAGPTTAFQSSSPNFAPTYFKWPVSLSVVVITGSMWVSEIWGQSCQNCTVCEDGCSSRALQLSTNAMACLVTSAAAVSCACRSNTCLSNLRCFGWVENIVSPFLLFG